MSLDTIKKINPTTKRYFISCLTYILIIIILTIHISNIITTKGDIWFGDFNYPEELVNQWDLIAKLSNKEAKRTDMQLYLCDAKSTAMLRLETQTGASKSGEWKNYEWKNTYCVAHSKEMTDLAGTSYEQYPVWYSFGFYTVQNIPPFIREYSGGDMEKEKFNFLMLAYSTNYDNYIGGPNSDPYLKTANYYTMQLIAGRCEKAEFTGEYEHDYNLAKENVLAMAEGEFHPNSLGSNRVYEDMVGNFDKRFNEVWHTAKLLSTCVESNDDGYLYKAEKSLGEDGMYHVQMKYSDKLQPILTSSKITTFGDWTYEFQTECVDFKSPTGDMPDGGKIAEIDSVGAANIIGQHIGTESVMSVRTPAKVGNTYTFFRTQENMVTCLKDGLKIIISDGPTPTPQEGKYKMTRYKHSENWSTDYTVNLRKLDSETGKPLEGVEFDILEAFDDSQLDETVLEDDNWENDNGTQFDKWNGWDAPEDSDGDDPCRKDQEITDEDGWLTGMTSIGGGSLTSDGNRAHTDTKNYDYTKGWCGSHPVPEFVEIPEPEEDEETGEITNEDEIEAAKAENDSLLKAYMEDIQRCHDLKDEGGYFCKADEYTVTVNIQDSYGYDSKELYEEECNSNTPIPDAKEELENDRDEHYVDFISLTYEYSARELSPRYGYIIHNKDDIHGVYENIDDTVHNDAIPIETVTVHSSQYYDYIENGIKHTGSGSSGDDGEESEFNINYEIDEIDDSVSAYVPETILTSSKVTKATPSDAGFIFEDEELQEEDEKTNKDNATPSEAKLDMMSKRINSTFSIESNEKGMALISNDADSQSGKPVRNSTSWTEPSIANNVEVGDGSYKNQGGTDWTFIVYDHRTEGEVHINKRDLNLNTKNNESFNNYALSQGDGSLEGAVYGLFAAEDISHPDGKTGIVYQKDNLVSVSTTDRNGNASFMAITEKPGSLFNYESGTIEETSFKGPSNLYTNSYEQHSSNQENWNNSQWYYPIENNQDNNGNCWIGRPLFLGSYYIKELTRSEGYELSTYGVEAEISNKNYYEAGGSVAAEGSVSVSEVKKSFRSSEDGKTSTAYEFTVNSNGTTNGYDIYIQGVDKEGLPAFYLTQKGTKEEYREWYEDETTYEQVLATPGQQVIISGKSVEAEAGDSINLPNGTNAVVKRVDRVASSPEKIKYSGSSGVIPNITTKIVPTLNDVDVNDFVNSCNQAFEKSSIKEAGTEAPYVLVDIGNDNTKWAEKLYEYLNSDDCIPFNAARIEKTITKNGTTYAVLRYSFILNTKVQDIVYVTANGTFYKKYDTKYSDGTSGYLYKAYPLHEVAADDYSATSAYMEWVKLPNERPVLETIQLYMDMGTIDYKSNQSFKSFWVYEDGEYLRDDDGNIYQKPVTIQVKKSGYVNVETIEENEIAAEWMEDGTYKIHINPEEIPADGKNVISIKYSDEDKLNTTMVTMAVSAAPSMNTSGSYIQNIVLPYPSDNQQVYSDGNTRNIPVLVLERPIRQRIKVMKDIQVNEDGTYEHDTYGKVMDTEAVDKMDNFRFKVYLKSNLERLYRNEDGELNWVDRNGNILEPEYRDTNGDGNYDTFSWKAEDGSEIDFPEYDKDLNADHIFTGKLISTNVQKLYTEVPHLLNSSATGDIENNVDSRSITSNDELYSYEGSNTNVGMTDRINTEQNSGYTRLLESIDKTVEDGAGKTRKIRSYNYEKFFAAVDMANKDKWDDDMHTTFTGTGMTNYPGQHWEETFYEMYQKDDADAAHTIENTDSADKDNTAGGDRDKSFKPFAWIREHIFKQNGEEKDYYNGTANNEYIENIINTSDYARANAEASDAVRQFAIDWYLKDEVSKLVSNNGTGEDQGLNGSLDYSDDVYDEALFNAIMKSYNYLKPFYRYDLDTIYSVPWDTSEDGGSDKDYATLSVDTPYENDDTGFYYGISSYLPYGTYVIREVQPGDDQLADFANKHYRIDSPKEIELPSIYNANGQMNETYNYDHADTPEILTSKYHIRFNEEWADNHMDDLRNYIIRAHNHDGDYEIYKYGLDIDKIFKTRIDYNGRNYTSAGFNISQDEFDPLKNYYNAPLVDAEKDGGNASSHYFADDKDYPGSDNGNVHYSPDEIEKRYHYGAISENQGTASNVLYPNGPDRDDNNQTGFYFKDDVATMAGNQTAYQDKYAPMLVPWTVIEPVTIDEYNATDFNGYADVKFRNTFYVTKLRIEKLDSETGENILHDDAIFAIYAAERYLNDTEIRKALDSGIYGTDENDYPQIGDVKLYTKDTTIFGSLEFLEGMNASNIQTARRSGAGELYSGVVPAGTPICKEASQIILTDFGTVKDGLIYRNGVGERTGDFKSFSTLNELLVVDEEDKSQKSYMNQDTGYFITPAPIGAGTYVLAEIKAPSGYIKTSPIAVEVYSDSVEYYKDGDRFSKVPATIYTENIIK